jgi:hypothetical protein
MKFAKKKRYKEYKGKLNSTRKVKILKASYSFLFPP